jgi:hypothetical protein
MWVLHRGPLDTHTNRRWLRVQKGFMTVLPDERELVPVYDIPLEKSYAVHEVPSENGTQIEIITPTGTHILQSNDPKVSIKDIILFNRK